jgi:hypothetical protein
MPVAPLRYFTVVPRPLSAAALVVRCSFLVVVPRPMPAAQDALGMYFAKFSTTF